MNDAEVEIEKLKHKFRIGDNKSLCIFLNISYNTLNSWIKRGEIPKKSLSKINETTENTALDRKKFTGPIERKTIDKINDNLYNLHYSSSLFDVLDHLYSLILFETIFEIYKKIELPPHEYYYHNENFDKQKYHEIHLWIPMTIIDFISTEHDNLDQNSIENITPDTFASQFTKTTFRELFEYHLVSKLPNKNNLEDIVIDKLYIVRSVLSSMPIDVIKYWINLNDSSTLKNEWLKFLSSRIN